jgi:hypothetical protein
MGIISIVGAYYDWDWFMNMWWHINMVEILTRNGARIFYTIVGLAGVVLGVLMMIGIVKP